MITWRKSERLAARWALTLLFFLGAALPAWAEYDAQGDVVVDTQTGLMWMKDTADTNESGTVTSADAVDWEGALAYCKSLPLAGHDDWRLPDINELQSLVDIDISDPAIDHVFTCQTDVSYWSGSPYAGGSHYAWGVYFGSGNANHNNNKGDTYYVRCVRSGP